MPPLQPLMQHLVEYQPKQHWPYFLPARRPFLLLEKASFQQVLHGVTASEEDWMTCDDEGWLLTSKFDVEVWESESPELSRFLLSSSGKSVTAEGEKPSSVNMSVQRKESRLDVIWCECIWQRQTHYEWDVNCHSLPVCLPNHASEALFTNVSNGPQMNLRKVSVSEWYEVGMTITPLTFP